MFDIELSVREFGGQAVVALRGELDLGSTPAVASHLLAAVAACGPSVILDLADLDNICPAGLGILVRVREWVRENGGDLALAAPRAPVRRTLEATGLADIFSVYPSVELAALGTHLAIFNGGRYAARCRPGGHTGLTNLAGRTGRLSFPDPVGVLGPPQS
jgi:anti-sigma B factor antagonist